METMQVKMTRSTAEVLAGLDAEKKEAVALIELGMLWMENPPPSAGHCYLMEQAGWVWNQKKQQYEGLND